MQNVTGFLLERKKKETELNIKRLICTRKSIKIQLLQVKHYFFVNNAGIVSKTKLKQKPFERDLWTEHYWNGNASDILE